MAGCSDSANSKVADLESKIEALEEKNENLSEQVATLSEENAALKDNDRESATSGASAQYSEEKKKIVDEIIALKKELNGSLTKAERLEIVNQIKALSKQIGETYQE